MLATVLAAVVAIATNSGVAYLLLIGLVVTWAIVGLHATSPTYRRFVWGEDPAAEAEKRWNLD